MTELMKLILVAAAELSTEVMYVFASARLAHFLAAMVFSLDLMVILLALLAQRLAVRHLLVRPMAEAMAFTPRYSKRQLRRLEDVFAVGFRLDRRGRAAPARTTDAYRRPVDPGRATMHPADDRRPPHLAPLPKDDGGGTTDEG